MYYLLICLFVAAIYLLIRHIYGYWERRGYPHIPPTFPWGNLGTTVFMKSSFGKNMYELYNQSTEPFVGIYMLHRPALLIRDPGLVRTVLCNDFEYFTDRGIHCNEKVEPLSESLFALGGQKWRNLRVKITPTFTSGKLKAMFPIILNVANEVQDYLAPKAAAEEVVNMRDVIMRYTLDIVGNVIFGCDVNSIKDPTNDFKYAADRLNNLTFVESIQIAMAFLLPDVLDTFNIKTFPKDLYDFAMKIVHETIEHREKNNVVRKDLMQLLLQLRHTGVISSDGDWNIDYKSTGDGDKSMTIEFIAAQTFLFFIAGNETTAGTTSYALFELGRKPELMKRAQEEVRSVLKQHDNVLSYESLKQMPFLDMCLKESMRKYPALPLLNRIATKDYENNDFGLKVEKGTPIIISLQGMHNDPKLFPDPLDFNPDRFADGPKEYDERAFLPFGEGPRICIAYRMGQVVAKTCLVKILSKYDFEPTSMDEIVMTPKSSLIMPLNGIPMIVRNSKYKEM